jgi:hypothetical protein
MLARLFIAERLRVGPLVNGEVRMLDVFLTARFPAIVI